VVYISYLFKIVIADAPKGPWSLVPLGSRRQPAGRHWVSNWYEASRRGGRAELRAVLYHCRLVVQLGQRRTTTRAGRARSFHLGRRARGERIWRRARRASHAWRSWCGTPHHDLHAACIAWSLLPSLILLGEKKATALFFLSQKGFDFGYGRDENVAFLPQRRRRRRRQTRRTVYVDGDFTWPTAAFALTVTIYLQLARPAELIWFTLW
jgi:hypothetical protein